MFDKRFFNSLFLLIKFSRLNYMFGNKKKVVKTKSKPRARSKLLNKRKLK